MNRWGRRGRYLLVAGSAVVGGIQLLVCTVSMAREDAAEPSDRSSHSTASRSSGGGRASQSSVEKKLEQILSNDQAILEKLQAVKEEVRIIQVRASSRASVQP